MEVYRNLESGHYIIERKTNNNLCDAPVNNNVVSCADFNDIVEDSARIDSLVIYNGFTTKTDSILIKVIDTLNNWTLVDSVWVGSGEQYVKVFPNSNYWVGYYSNTLDCGFERMWNLLNSSVDDLGLNLLKIYPNPTSGNINILLPNTSSSYHLIDFTGK